VVELNARDESARAVFGTRLRETRESAGIQLDDIVVETKVSKAIFRGMEAGDFTRLPEFVFSRSFVAQYARTIGVDGDELLQLFDRAWAEHEAANISRTDLTVLDEAVKPSIHWRFWFPVTVGLVIIVSAAVAILRGSVSMDHDLARDPRRSGVQVATETPPPVIAAVAIAATRSPVVEFETAADPMVELTVTVHPGEECWIHYRDREGMTGQHLLAGGETLPLTLAGPVKLTVGNAGAAEIRVGGRTLGELGMLGQVIHTEVTHDGLTLHGDDRSGSS
jgi:cytoskeletal protein RodZ